MINNVYFQKLDFIEADELSRELSRYQLKVTSFGHFKSRKTISITNTSLPHHRIIYITQGPVTYTINQTSVTLHPGDVLYTPANTVYSACGQDYASPPEFLYLYFQVMPHHLIHDFTRLLKASSAMRVFDASQSRVEYYFHAILEEYQQQRSGYYHKIENLLNLIVLELLRSRDFKRTAGPQTAVPHTTHLLNMATSYIAGNLNQPIRIRELSRICGVSENYLYKIFRQTLQMSPQEYILNCKIEHGAGLLENSDLTITQIARELAFSSPNHFSNTFYRIMNIRPREYRDLALKR